MTKSHEFYKHRLLDGIALVLYSSLRMYFIILALSFAVSAAVSSFQQLPTFPASVDGTYLTGLSNTTASPLNSSIGNALRTDCNPAFSGSHLNFQSCVQAFGQIEPTTDLETWQKRGSRTHGTDIFALPYRWLSRT